MKLTKDDKRSVSLPHDKFVQMKEDAQKWHKFGSAIPKGLMEEYTFDYVDENQKIVERLKKLIEQGEGYDNYYEDIQKILEDKE